MKIQLRKSGVIAAAAAAAGLAVAASLAGLAGCSPGSAGTRDQQLTETVQSRLRADPALQGMKITGTAQDGVVTLHGNVNAESARLAAAHDAEVPGVASVANDIATMTGARGSEEIAATNPAAAADESAGMPMGAQMSASAPVEVEAGTPLHVRLNEGLDSGTATAGQSFEGEIATPIRVNGQLAIPQGARVNGTVAAADSAGHFEGQSRLVLELTGLSFGGEDYNLSSHSVTRLSGSRGKRSGEAIGGSAAVGAIIGALAGHGKGAAIGGLAGAGAGTAAEAFTKPPEVVLPAESTLSFTLSAPLQVVPAGQS